MTIELELSEDRAHELEELMTETGISTKRDLLNDALALFRWAVRESQSGRMVASVDQANHQYKELAMSSLERASLRANLPSSRTESAAF